MITHKLSLPFFEHKDELVAVDGGFLFFTNRNIFFLTVQSVKCLTECALWSWAGGNYVCREVSPRRLFYYEFVDGELVPVRRITPTIREDRRQRVHHHVGTTYVMIGGDWNANPDLTGIFGREPDESTVVVFRQGAPTYYKFHEDAAADRVAVSLDGLLVCVTYLKRYHDEFLITMFDIE